MSQSSNSGGSIRLFLGELGAEEETERGRPRTGDELCATNTAPRRVSLALKTTSWMAFEGLLTLCNRLLLPIISVDKEVEAWPPERKSGV